MGPWQQASVVLAVIMTGVLIAKELYTTFWVNRIKDKKTLDVAEQQQPEIMRQLELGNFKAAAEGISIAQTFVSDQLRYAQEELKRLREQESKHDEHVEALEAEAAGWESKARELEAKVLRLEGKVEALERLLNECKREIRKGNRT